ncbi:hypothetical protein PZB75_19135 [Streptomyces sp. AM 4-1-1]|uniref:hypothetical protein n=1 Tax=Streptomyces sp. AM 4-1-1 TaxID=3028710 RepID=UPI0023B9CC06|nr:hypothetical protein [Streptomyces sp. AM 4-1-1]WEH35286.1 hypothetical protein PZB75_19135 [Streptomyces sp. AM 4-1-1]
MMRRRMRFAGVLLVVVLALTGFQTSSHSGKSRGGKSRSGSGRSTSKHKGSSGSSGGGCSNSKKNNSDYHGHGTDNYGSTGGGTSGGTTSGTMSDTTETAGPEPETSVVDCVSPGKGRRKADTTSTVRLTARGTGSHTYEVDVTFLDAHGVYVDSGEAEVRLDGGDTRTLSVRMDSPSRVSRVKKCAVTATYVS